MIPKFQMTAMRNATYFQFISSACELFARFGVDFFTKPDSYTFLSATPLCV